MLNWTSLWTYLSPFILPLFSAADDLLNERGYHHLVLKFTGCVLNMMVFLQKGLGMVAISSNSVVSHPEVGASHSLDKGKCVQRSAQG